MSLPADVLKAIKASSEPLMATQVARAVTPSAKLAEVKAALNDLAQTGAVHAFTLGRSTAYCATHPEELCWKALLAMTSGRQDTVSPAKLKSSLPRTLRPWFNEALAKLIVKGHAQWQTVGKRRLVALKR